VSAGIAVCVFAACASAAPSLGWSGVVEVDNGQALSAISCPSLGLCVVGDRTGHAIVSTNPAGGAGAWSEPFAIKDASALTSISCASATLCVAVDSEGRVIVSGDPSRAGSGAWSEPFALKGASALTSVSCASNTLCVAVDGEGHVVVSTDPGAATASAWSEPLAIAGATTFTAVSCASTTLCAAVDSEGHLAISTEPAAGAGAWHARLIDPNLSLVAVSCFSSASCVAVDGAGDAIASSDATAAASAGAGPGSGATWSSTAFDVFGAPAALSCTSIGLCAAVDGGGYAFASDDPTVAPPAWPSTPIDPSRVLTGVSCVSEGLCVAVDASGRVLAAEVPPPTVASGPASEVSHTTATLTGAVNPNDAALASCRFEYGTGTEYGLSVPCASVPGGGGAQSVAASIAGLTADTTYHYRLLASSAIGQGAGADQSFMTLAPALVEPHPSISGTPAPGQHLTCRSGVSASGVTLAYAWLRDTQSIAAADDSTYLVGGADVSHHLQCRVTATTAEGSKSATSAFVTVPAGGVGTISETTVGTPRAGRDAVTVALTCSGAAAGSCTIRLRLTVLETLRGSRLVGLVAQRARRVTVTVGASTVRLKPRQHYTATVALNATGRRLLQHARQMAVRLSVSGTIVGAISASLRSATVILGAPANTSARHRGRSRRDHVARAGSSSAGPSPSSPPSPSSLRPASSRRSASIGRARQASGGATPASVLAPTPYMGWDTYFTFGSHYDEAAVLEQASQLLTRGLLGDGYDYVWLDVGWWQGTRNAAGEITVNPAQWPHGMAWLTSTLHAAGLKVGLYTDAGREGCGGPTRGSYGRYQQDVNTFAAWGFDAVKVDFCGGVRQGLQPAAAYAAFHEAIVHNASRRPMLLSICDYLQPSQFASEDPTFENSAFDSYTFGPSSGNSWRTDTDVGFPGDVQFSDVLRNLDADAAQPQAAGPGHWNDPDYLGPDQGMGETQFRTQFSMWAMLAAPLMISADLLSLSGGSQQTLSNREVIAIDQDPAGLQARLLSSNGEGQVWVKPLSDGSRAVALLNRGSSTLRIATTAAAVGMPRVGSFVLRNVWTGAVTRVGTGGKIAASVPGDGATLLLVSAS
jgi:hypothetical protein